MTADIATDEAWMRHALALAQSAEQAGEVPVGAVLVQDGNIIAEGTNSPIAGHDPTAHAEIQALRRAGQSLQNYRLLNTVLYVTMEPCPMCAGALVNARVSRLVYGAPDMRVGAAGSVFDIVQSPQVNHRLEVTGGVLEEECRTLLQTFFRSRRQ
ncbi:MAG: tRNA adenosine(34) deaminase TadA [Gammaproteobacteria bacterium]|nr:tRNA adenosine(34) deaminase TadA [Gammaproteobacteria bacterium]